MDDGDLLLLCATAAEGAGLAHALQEPVTATVAGKTVVCGRLDGALCRLVYSGIGPVNAAHALTCQVERRRPQLVLQFGIGGAYVPAGVPAGSVVVASEEIYGDLGVLTPQGWQPADLIGIPVVAGAPPRFNRFPLDPQRVAHAVRLLAPDSPEPSPGAPGEDRGKGAGNRPGVPCGPFLTLSQVTGARALGDALYRRFGALCESMEGAAAAHVCALYDLPFLELRGVSNLVEDRDRSRWQIAAATAGAQRAVRRLVAHGAELAGGQP